MRKEKTSEQNAKINNNNTLLNNNLFSKKETTNQNPNSSSNNNSKPTLDCKESCVNQNDECCPSCVNNFKNLNAKVDGHSSQIKFDADSIAELQVA